MRKSLLSLAVLYFGLGVAVPGAFAFTIVTPGAGGSSSANLTDPDQKAEDFADRLQSGGSNSSMPFGNGHLQFSVSGSNGSDSSANANDRFIDDPAGRTVPSANFPGAH